VSAVQPRLNDGVMKAGSRRECACGRLYSHVCGACAHSTGWRWSRWSSVSVPAAPLNDTHSRSRSTAAALRPSMNAQ